jgi:hypothetical protein
MLTYQKKYNWTMLPRGQTVSCKSPPPIRARIDSDLPIQACIDLGGELVHLFLFKNDFTSLRHQMTSQRQNLNWSGKHSWRAFIWGTTQYGFVDFKIWPWGTPFSIQAFTMKFKIDWLIKLISYVADHVLLSHEVWSWSWPYILEK